MPTRPDATLVTELHAYQRLMPSLLPRRMDAVVFLRVPVEVETTLAWLDKLRETTGRRITLFQVVLAAVAATLAERPQMNRFVKGGRLWQRDHVALTFAVKRAFEDHARIVSTKVRIPAEGGLRALADATDAAIHSSRTDPAARERRTNQAAAIPPVLLPFALAVSDWLDRHGWLGATTIEGSPLHTSAMVSNLGSLGLDGALHHLYEAGTCSINATLGTIDRVPVCAPDGTIRTPRMATIAFAYDERICDGFYAAKTIQRLTERIADPASMW